MYTSLATDQVIPILLGGMSAIILGLGLLLVGPRWRRKHGHRISSILILSFALAGIGALILRNSAFALTFGLLASLWLIGWASRADLCARLTGGVTRLLRHHQFQAIALVL